ncbi:MAG: ABC transporter ATP-binding protein [Planctomycetales bacterium]|nr:ABC transporter ATP-binding protein [Planctomycetales bacterium]
MMRGRQIIQGDDVEEFWALRDVSFEVNEGEVVGIIGRNGAGKSTLLKILSRITEPTTGRVTLRGRVASLLEVGTGFHPELTGRENIFLNGAILGMTRGEIKRKFDEIVGFAEVERFLDTPVKRYSSGMYVRLAFAVAAHLEPEILVVDEVLAVGDAQFQKKCLGKMQDVAQGGRTVLFVSHNMAAVSTLCSRALVLVRGRLEQSCDTSTAIASFLESLKQDAQNDLASRSDIKGTRAFELERIVCLSADGAEGAVASGEEARIRISYRRSDHFDSAANLILAIRDSFGRPVAAMNTRFTSALVDLPREGVIECVTPSLPLVAGFYSIDAYVYLKGTHSSGGDLAFHLADAAQIHVLPSDKVPASRLQDAANAGVMALDQIWTQADKAACVS